MGDDLATHARIPEILDVLGDLRKRARLALLGLDAKVYPIEQGGSTLYRVRVGPYGSIDDINRIRKLMAENSIEAQVVRLK